MEKRRTVIWNILLMGALAAATEVFAVLSLLLLGLSSPWGALAIAGASLLIAVCFAAAVTFLFLGKETLCRGSLALFLTALFFAVLLYVLLKTGFFAVMRDEALLEEYLRKSGVWMGAVFTLLQFLQVVILPIPSTVTVVAGAALFGPLVGSLLSLLGIVLGSLVAFLIGRYAGMRVVSWLVGRDTLEKWLKKIKGKDKLLLSAMFLLPVFPDDVLCFVAGLSSMSIPYFLVVILISRVLAIFATSYSVSLIPFDTWWGLLIWGILLVLVVLLFIVLYRKADVILGWFERRRRGTRVEEKTEKGEFSLEVLGPDGAVVKKGVRKDESDPPEKPSK